MYYFCNTNIHSKNNSVRVTILQTDIQWIQPAINQDNAEALINKAQRSDLFVLPEMWTTGFVVNPENENTCIEDEHRSLERMRYLATICGGAVSGSIAIRNDEGKYYNRHFFVRPDGTYDYYDKRHLFAYGGEDKHYESGTRRVIIEYSGLRILLATCYDLRFPVWLRNNGDYDAILITANWPERRRNAWNVLLRARAIENQCYVIAANRTGKDNQCQYCGDSMIIDAKGNIMAETKGCTEQLITAEINIESLNSFRRKFPVLRDKDNYNLI